MMHKIKINSWAYIISALEYRIVYHFVILLEFLAKLGAHHGVHHTICISVEFRDDLPESVNRFFPFGLNLVSLEQGTSMAACR